MECQLEIKSPIPYEGYQFVFIHRSSSVLWRNELPLTPTQHINNMTNIQRAAAWVNSNIRKEECGIFLGAQKMLEPHLAFGLFSWWAKETRQRHPFSPKYTS